MPQRLMETHHLLLALPGTVLPAALLTPTPAPPEAPSGMRLGAGQGDCPEQEEHPDNEPALPDSNPALFVSSHSDPCPAPPPHSHPSPNQCLRALILLEALEARFVTANRVGRGFGKSRCR
jgi:hypothetical protein